MKRLTILGIIACVGLLFAPAAVIGDPAGPPGELDVNVVNEPTVKAKQEGNWSVTVETPILEAVQARSVITHISPAVFVYEVPEGTRLVIEYVSFSMLSSQPLVVLQASITTIVEGNIVDHFINVPPIVNYGTTPDEYAKCGGGQVTKIYADPGTEVWGFIQAISPQYAGWVQISGHLVPYE